MLGVDHLGGKHLSEILDAFVGGGKEVGWTVIAQ
jgi:hypothetical protein